MRSPSVPPTSGRWGLQAVGVSALLAAPIVAVTYPPLTDLPQQVAQMHLLEQTLAGDARFEVQWWHPNKLAYLPIALGWLVGGGLWAAKVVATTIVVAWTVALHALAAARGRSLTAAALASTLVWNHATYWGLLTFQLGFPLFVAWMLALDRETEARPEQRAGEARGSWRQAAMLMVLALGLYSAHVFWLAAALAWAAVDAVRRRLAPRVLALRALAAAPALLLVAAWYPTLDRSGFVSDVTFGHGLLERLDPRMLVATGYGGLQGWIEPTVAGLLALAALLGLWRGSRRRSRREPVDRAPSERFDSGIASAALLFALAYLSLPAVAQATVLMSSRWLPPAFALALLALPMSSADDRGRDRALSRLLPAAALLLIVAGTVVTWRSFEREELAGFDEAIERIEPGSRVLGLDLRKTSERIRGFPFYHLHAWAQVLRGSELSTSFAGHASSLVVYRELPHTPAWTPGLDWAAERVRESDVPHFDAVLVHAEPRVLARFVRDPRLSLVGTPAPWSLLQVNPAVRLHAEAGSAEAIR